MQVKEVLKLQAEASYKELLLSIDGLTEEQSWGRVQLLPGEYMHAEGSIISTVLHVAGCKFLYGSSAYRDLEIRWRDIVARFEEFWPSWQATKDYLQESHDYWLSTWEKEEDFDRMVNNFRCKPTPSWKIVWTIAHHDNYHAGQIQLLRSSVPPSSTPPPEEGELWREACGDLSSW